MKPVTPRPVVALQDRLAKLLGSSADGRAALVGGMLRRDASEATSYWLQLVVSIGIATLGLVVGSSAVVIGAMLVAPLMGPIVGLAMGLASGSPFLVLRSAGRIGLSVVVGVGGAALITLLLPFHELNAEISARASPTVLDLITAGFCALAGVYASLRPGSDTAATAAGTSIGISLVPPLCASGYGLGTAAWPIAGGAALLFLTNLVAIVVVGTVSFVAAGFNRIAVVSLERDELAREATGSPIARALARRLARVFESRWGPVLRFLMPFLLLTVVYVPLGKALDEVAWQVRVRSAIRKAIAREPSHVVQSRVRVERHQVEVVVVLLGDTHEANTARTRMDAAIRQTSGVTPRLEIFAIPDAASFAGLESTLLTPHVAAAPVTPPRASPDEQVDAARARIRGVVEALWPATAAGEALVVDVGTAESGPLRIRVVHIGPALRADASETLQRSIESGLGKKTELVDVAVPSGELTRRNGDLVLMAKVASGVRAIVGVPTVSVCVGRPPEAAPSEIDFARALDETLAAHPRVTTTMSPSWSIRFVRGECPTATPGDAGAGTPGDAGVLDASAPE
jgi:uncharacterized hydrophobic protein (TIGR00271 family)